MPQPIPITWARVKELDLDVARYHTCSAPDGRRNAGCPCWSECKLDAEKKKGQAAYESTLRAEDYDAKGACPCNKGVTLFKRRSDGTVKAKNDTWSCYSIPNMAKQAELNDGRVSITAGEGETIKVRGSVTRDEDVPGQGRVRFVDDKNIDVVVPVYKDPQDETLLDLAIAKEALDKAISADDRETHRRLVREAATGSSGKRASQPAR